MQSDTVDYRRDALVVQLCNYLVDNVDDHDTLAILADRLEDLGAEQEVAWVLGIDLTKLVETADGDGEMAALGWDRRESTAPVRWQFIQLLYSFECLAARLGVACSDADAVPGRLQGSLAWDLVGRIYSAVAQAAALEGRYHRADEGPYPDDYDQQEEQEDEWE